MLACMWLIPARCARTDLCAWVSVCWSGGEAVLACCLILCVVVNWKHARLDGGHDPTKRKADLRVSYFYGIGDASAGSRDSRGICSA